MSNVFVDTVGLRIHVDMGIDVSAAGTVAIRYIKPDGITTGTWTAVIEDASSGRIYYDTVTDDLDTAGIWKLNAIWDPDGASIYYGNTACLTVRQLGDSC